MYVLRKSYGPYSAGTMVDKCPAPATCFDKDGLFIPEDLVVKRRNMTRYGPAINSRDRRRREKEVQKALGINR
jgi:hypothetical protein